MESAVELKFQTKWIMKKEIIGAILNNGII